MRIAVFIKSTTHNKGHGGLETQNKVLCESLAKNGHEVIVFTPKPRDFDQTELDENNVRYVFIECSYRYLFSNLYSKSWFNRSFQVFSTYNDQKKFNLVIGQSSGAIGIIRKKNMLGIPIISISHGTTLGELRTTINNISTPKDIYHFIRNLQYVIRQFFGRQREVVLHSNKVIAVSNAVKQNLIDETFAPENLITVINNGIFPEPFEDVDTNKNYNGDTVLFVGQINKDKGIDQLVYIFSKPEFASIRLRVIGDGPLRNYLEDYVIANNLQDRIKFMGKISYSEIITEYKSPDVFAFAFPTNRDEGFPMVLVEASFAGLPIIAFDKGGVSDIVKDGINGFLLQPRNFEAFSESVLKLYDDRELVKKMSQEALSGAYAEFTVDVMIKKYLEVFRKVLE